MFAKKDGKLKRVYCYNKPETNLSTQPIKGDKLPNAAKKTPLTKTNLPSKSSKMNKNSNDLCNDHV